MGTDPGTGDRESGGTPTPERCRGDQEAQGPACCRESATGGGQEGECAKDRGVCKQRYTCACVHTHAHTHTQSFTRSQRLRCGIRQTQLTTRLWYPEPGRKTGGRDEAARERPSHLVALGPHTHRDRNVEARRRWPQSYEGATPCASGLVSEPSSRGQVCECESVCMCAEGTQAIALQPTLKLGECPGAPSQRAPRN